MLDRYTGFYFIDEAGKRTADHQEDNDKQSLKLAIKHRPMHVSQTPKSLHSFNNIPIQAKLTVNRPNDVFEEEADEVADKVMRMPGSVTIQRKCAQCEKEEEEQ